MLMLMLMLLLQFQRQLRQGTATPASFDAMLRASAAVGDLDVTKALVRRMKRERIRLDGDSQTHVLNAMRRAHANADVASLFEALERSDRASAKDWDVRLNSCETPREAHDLFVQSPPEFRDARLYTSALRKCTGDVDLVLDMWNAVTVRRSLHVSLLARAHTYLHAQQCR